MRRLVTALLIVAGAPAAVAPTAHADKDITAEAEDPGDSEPGDGPYVIDCTYRELIVPRSGWYTHGGYTYVYVDARWYRFIRETREAWVRAYESCTWSDGSTTRGAVWQLISDPDPGVAIDPAYDEAVKTIGSPVPRLSPVGPGYVNLGMWLAIAAPAGNPVVVRAQAGSSWAEVTAHLATTTFDMGNGDTVTCDGIGTPIPTSAIDSPDEGPCGYTYREPSGDTPYRVTVTTTWTVTYELSDGRTGTRPDVDLSTTVDYPVGEIQTVGTG